MPSSQNLSAGRRPLTIHFDQALLRRAQDLGVDVEAAALAGVARAVQAGDRSAQERIAAEAMSAWNSYDAEHGSVADEFSED